MILQSVMIFLTFIDFSAFWGQKGQNRDFDPPLGTPKIFFFENKSCSLLVGVFPKQ